MKATLNDLLNAKGVSEPLREAVKALIDRLEAAESDALEQARLNGMGGEREAALMAKLEAAEKERESWKGLAQQFGNELDTVRVELETERMRLVACGVVALANTPDSAKQAREMRPEYWSASCGDVARMVDENIKLRAKVEAMEKQEPVAWAATDETCRIVEALSFNQSRRFDTPLYALPGAQPAPSVPDIARRMAELNRKLREPDWHFESIREMQRELCALEEAALAAAPEAKSHDQIG